MMATLFATPINNASATIGVTTVPAAFPYNITLTSGGGAKFPSLTGSNYYRVTICQVAFAYSPTATTNNYTIYNATLAASPADTLTLHGLLEGTTDRAYSPGDIVEARITSAAITDITGAINAIENAPYAVDGNVVHIAGTESITGTKTFTSIVTAANQSSLNQFVANYASSASAYNFPIFAMQRSRGTVGSPTNVSGGDYLGGFYFYGYNGGIFEGAGSIIGDVLSISGTSHLVGSFYFTCNDGTTTYANMIVMTISAASTQFSSTNMGFFNATPVAQQTGGVATAGGTYTGTEQGMINRMYTALRNLGLMN